MSDDLLVQAIIGYWGERCADTDPDCPCCQAWLAYDRQAAERDRLRDALRFYSNPSDYVAPYTGGMGKLWGDCGETARAALGGKP